MIALFTGHTDANTGFLDTIDKAKYRVVQEFVMSRMYVGKFHRCVVGDTSRWSSFRQVGIYLDCQIDLTSMINNGSLSIRS